MNIQSWNQLVQFLRDFLNPSGEEVGQYDFVGAIMLFDAITQNLADNCHDVDLQGLEETEYELTPKRREFLQKLLRIAR